jgi:NAD(P)-dependent dehydrogenase (short-subunit alcohol dehydrogenase family)
VRQDWVDKVVVITGASAGVGRATACAFAAGGARIGLLARGEDGLAGACADVERAGGQASAIPTDVADPDQVEAAAAAIEECLGPIDVWVNNAMASVFARFWEIEPVEYRRATEVTYLGTVHGTLAALKRMRARDRGTIVQVGSALAYRGIPLQSAYCGAKHAIEGFTESLRAELLHERSAVHLTMVQMPALNTPQFTLVRTRLPRHPQPVPPIYQPEVAAEAIVWAAAHRRREMWVGRSTPVVIAGNRVAPWLGDRYLARTGFDSQQTDEPSQPDRPNNLEQPADEHRDYGTRGPFADRSTDRSPQLWASQHHGVLGAIGAAGLGAVAAGLAMRRSR